MISMKKIRGTKPGATHVIGPGGLDVKAFASWYRERAIEQWNRLDLAALAKVAAVVERAQIFQAPLRCRPPSPHGRRSRRPCAARH